MFRGMRAMQNGGGFFDTNPSVGLTVPEGQQAKERLEVLLYVHLGIALSKIIILGFGFGFGDLIQCLILWCGISQHNYCNVFLYMIACIVLGGQIAVAALFALQTGAPLTNSFKTGITGANDGFTLVYTCLIGIFYLLAVVFSFKGYKEFKYSLQRGSGGNMTTSVRGPMSYGTLK